LRGCVKIKYSSVLPLSDLFVCSLNTAMELRSEYVGSCVHHELSGARLDSFCYYVVARTVKHVYRSREIQSKFDLDLQLVCHKVTVG